MRRAGLIVWQAHQAAARRVRPGVTTAELNRVYRQTFQEYDAYPLFLNYGGPPPFPAEACISVNEQIVHGIPGDRVLQEGDIVSLDTGCRLDGWCGDAAVTLPVGNIAPETQRLLDVTRETLDLAIERLSSAEWWSEIAREMEKRVLAAGFSVVQSLVGHGIGRELHEPPQVPNYYSDEFAQQDDFSLRPGVVLAIEPMVNAGVAEDRCLDDAWTLVTRDGAPSAHFEHTVALTADGAIRLTGPPNDDELDWVPEWLRNPDDWVRW